MFVIVIVDGPDLTATRLLAKMFSHAIITEIAQDPTLAAARTSGNNHTVNKPSATGLAIALTMGFVLLQTCVFVSLVSMARIALNAALDIMVLLARPAQVASRVLAWMGTPETELALAMLVGLEPCAINVPLPTSDQTVCL